GLVELDWRAGERALGITALALQPRAHGERGGNHFRLVVLFEFGFDVRLLFGVRDANRIGSGFGGLEGVRHSERDVLAVVANDIVFERRAALVADAFESRSLYRAEDLSDVLAMKNRSHAGHFLGRRGVELDHA